MLRMARTVRTRFAPSPTGFLHVGNVRSALFPWLVARQAHGVFILRIEDTDQAREVSGATDVMKETLRWLGIEWDEGPDKPGEHGPYIQSQRKAIYERWAHRMIAEHRAYADVRTPAELDALREDAKTKNTPFLARNYRPQEPPAWQPGMPLRFLSDPKAYSWHDEVMGDLHAGPEAVDDFILLKSDGYPTYNFAHIVDDAEMEITHVIRGLEYIASMPKYLNLYEALGLTVPILAHVPHVMAPDGKRKLSKRDGAKSMLTYRDEGYLPEAMLNFLASLGWNDGTEQEIFTTQELIDKFSLARVQRAGARFDERRLLWMDGAHIRSLSTDELYARAKTYWPNEASDADEAYKKQVLGLVQERLKFLKELPALTRFFFVDLPVDMQLITDHKQLARVEKSELRTFLEQSRAVLAENDFTVDSLTECLNGLLEQTGTKPAVLFSLLRIASTEAPASPGLADTLAVLGKETTLRRIDTLLQAL